MSFTLAEFKANVRVKDESAIQIVGNTGEFSIEALV